MQLFLCNVKASFFSTLRFCLRMSGYNVIGSDSVIFIFTTSLKVAVSKGKDLLPYELILSLTSRAPVQTGKMRKYMAVYSYRMIKTLTYQKCINST